MLVSVTALLRRRCRLRTFRMYVVIASDVCMFSLHKKGCLKRLLLFFSSNIVRRLREGFQYSVVIFCGGRGWRLWSCCCRARRTLVHTITWTTRHSCSFEYIPKQQIASHMKKCSSKLLRMAQHGRLPIDRCIFQHLKILNNKKKNGGTPRGGSSKLEQISDGHRRVNFYYALRVHYLFSLTHTNQQCAG